MKSHDSQVSEACTSLMSVEMKEFLSGQREDGGKALPLDTGVTVFIMLVHNLT